MSSELEQGTLGTGPQIRAALFEPLPADAVPGRTFTVTAAGTGIEARGLALRARVGEQAVLDLVLVPGGGGFVGLLAHPPRDGDRLYVGYGSPTLATEFAYRAPSVA